MPASWLFGAGSASTIHARIQWLVVACTVPVFLLAVLWLVLSYQRGRDALLQTNLQAARSLVQAVDREIDATVQVLQALATATSIDDRDYRRFQVRKRARPCACGRRQHRAVRHRSAGLGQRRA